MQISGLHQNLSKYEITPKVALLALSLLGTSGVTAFWLYSDRHNDERYVSRVVYERDQKNFDKKLDEIKDDQKKLIDHLLKKNP